MSKSNGIVEAERPRGPVTAQEIEEAPSGTVYRTPDGGDGHWTVWVRVRDMHQGKALVVVDSGNLGLVGSSVSYEAVRRTSPKRLAEWQRLGAVPGTGAAR